MKNSSSAYAIKTFKQDKVAWSVLIIFVLAFVFGMKVFRENDRVQLRPWKSPVSPRATITVLEFDRVVLDKSKSHIYQEDFRKRLKALDEDGFEAVSLSDIFKFYYEEKPLPEKSVLLVFANAYLETYVAVDPILREMKWPATMTVNTEQIAKRETFFLYWDRLRRMVNSGVWDLVGDLRWESEDPIDYKSGLALMEANLPGYQLLAESPFMDDFNHHTKKTKEEESNDLVLKTSFPLRFVNSFVGVNDRSSDPLRLRRLRVKPRWKPGTLLTLMNNGIRASVAGFENSTEAESIWFRDDGEMIEATSNLKYLPRQNTRLARVTNTETAIRPKGTHETAIFFPAGKWTRNWVLKARVRLDRGQFWVRQISSETDDDWRIGGNSENLNVQVRDAMSFYKNLANSEAGITRAEWHQLMLIKRGNGIVVHWDDRPLWDFPVSIPGNINGDVGLWAWSDEGEGSVSLSDVSIAFFPDDIRWLKKYPQEDAVQFLLKQTKRVSGVTTITHTVQGGQVRSVAFDETLFQIISHRYGWKFISTIQVLPQKLNSEKIGFKSAKKVSDADVGIFSMTKIKELVKQNHWTQLHIDLSRLVRKGNGAWHSSIVKFAQELQKLNCRLYITTEGGPDVSQALQSKFSLFESDSKSNR